MTNVLMTPLDHAYINFRAAALWEAPGMPGHAIRAAWRQYSRAHEYAAMTPEQRAPCIERDGARAAKQWAARHE